MYAVIGRYEFDEYYGEELKRKLQDFYVPLLKQAPGFVAYYWLDMGQGSGASLTVFEYQTGAAESVRNAAAFVKQLGIGTRLRSYEEGKVQAHTCREAGPLPSDMSWALLGRPGARPMYW